MSYPCNKNFGKDSHFDYLILFDFGAIELIEDFERSHCAHKFHVPDKFAFLGEEFTLAES